jgi:signal transduction histidine kinase
VSENAECGVPAPAGPARSDEANAAIGVLRHRGDARLRAREAFLQRTLAATILFAVAAVLVTGLLAWMAYQGVHRALATEFGRRLETLARTSASQISPGVLRDAELLGEEGSGYLALQVLLEELHSSTGLVYAAALDSTGTTIYDTRGVEHQGEISPLDTLARSALRLSLLGEVAVTPIYRIAGEELRSGLAPIRSGRGVPGVVVMEARVDYLHVLGDFRRTLLLTTLLGALGILVLAVGIIRVVGSAAQLERRLSRAENLAAMGRLTATLAHEIRNPLAIIRGSAERLGRLEPEAARWAQSVIEETDRLSRTVGRYLQFARGEVAATGAGDAAQALNETMDLLEGEFRARRATLVRPESPPARLPVRLDNESLKQVFLNLMLNALEAISEGGRLTVGVAERRGRVAVSFADNGPGIPADTLRQLGNPFITTKTQGSGLGLFLSRRLVRSAGGDLEIESAVGRGTTCTVVLPRGET